MMMMLGNSLKFKGIAPRSAARAMGTYVDKLKGTKYEDGPEDFARVEAKRQMKEEKKKLSKNRLIVGHFKEIFNSSSLVLFVNGTVSDLGSKEALASIGFRSKRIKSSLVKITASKLDEEAGSDEDHLKFATSMAQGLTSVVYLDKPLLTLASSQNLDKLESVIPIKETKKGQLKSNQQLLCGAFIKDHGKSQSNIWLTKAGVNLLFETLVKEGALVQSQGQTVTDFEPHALFHAKVVSTLQGGLSAIRQPLVAPAERIRSTVQSIPTNVTQTFQKIQMKLEEEQKQEGSA